MEQAVVLPPLFLSLTLHEYAHARVALAFGDPTALRAGRVSLNPLRHLDPIGTLMLIFSGIIGWAKPVPVNQFLLRPPKLGDICVSAAGPLTNLVLAAIGAALFRLASAQAGNSQTSEVILDILWVMVVANLGMCFFNLIPLFPLDGHHIVRELLPRGSQDGFMRWQLRFGPLLLMGMLIGPRLAKAVTGKPMPIDPLNMYMTYAIVPVARLLGLPIMGS